MKRCLGDGECCWCLEGTNISQSLSRHFTKPHLCSEGFVLFGEFERMEAGGCILGICISSSDNTICQMWEWPWGGALSQILNFIR